MGMKDVLVLSLCVHIWKCIMVSFYVDMHSGWQVKMLQVVSLARRAWFVMLSQFYHFPRLDANIKSTLCSVLTFIEKAYDWYDKHSCPAPRFNKSNILLVLVYLYEKYTDACFLFVCFSSYACFWLNHFSRNWRYWGILPLNAWTSIYVYLFILILCVWCFACICLVLVKARRDYQVLWN